MLENAVLYARIILLALPFNVLQLLFRSFCVTAEKPRLGLTITVMSGVTNMVMVAAAELLAAPLAGIFVGYDAELMEMTVSGFRIFALSFLFMGYAIYGSGFFTALNDGLTSALISFLRTLVFQVAAVLLLPELWGLDGVWISIVAAEFMAVVFSAIFLIAKRKKYHY